LFLLWAALLQLPSYGTVLKKGLEKKKWNQDDELFER
jgi:hypothetical protein